MVDPIHCDILVIGGGIAGLWTANRLLQAGWNVLVLEASALGGGQTLASQGILHSGVKYGIDGSNRDIALQLKALPPRWMKCIQGSGELDLSSVQMLAQNQYLWSRDRVIGSFTSAMAGKAMQGDVREVPKPEWPTVLSHNPPSGALYEVREGIMDVQSVVQALAAPLVNRTIAGAIRDYHLNPNPQLGIQALTIDSALGQTLHLKASAFVFTAGSGNESAAAALGLPPEITQRRPLRMVLIRNLESPLYGHCVTASPKPRATITAHPHHNAWTWYLGGEIAEKGASRSPLETLQLARTEMESIFPSIDWKSKEWATFAVDRAEPRDPKGWLPPEPRLLHQGNTTLAWPTKLVYAPLLADRVLAHLAEQPLAPSSPSPSLPPPNLPQAPIGQLPWQQNLHWQRL